MEMTEMKNKLLKYTISRLDKQSRMVLAMISEYGPATEYRLGVESRKFGLDRDTIRRRLLGTSIHPSLVKMGFVEAEERKYRTNMIAKMYRINSEFKMFLDNNSLVSQSEPDDECTFVDGIKE